MEFRKNWEPDFKRKLRALITIFILIDCGFILIHSPMSMYKNLNSSK